MVGGEAADFEAARPVLEAVGQDHRARRPAGAGQTVKAANQLIVAGTIELLAEAIVFLEAYGVDTEAALKVLAGGLAGNAILDRKAREHARPRVRRPASGSTCTTRTWASSPRPPARPASRSRSAPSSPS